MRRQRRRVATVNRDLCRTNGCATFLEPDPNGSELRCPICGYTRRTRQD